MGGICTWSCVDAVKSHRAAVPDGSPGRRKESLRAFDPLHGLAARRRLGVVVLGQAVDLLDVKDGVALHEGNGALGFLAGLARRSRCG